MEISEEIQLGFKSKEGKTTISPREKWVPNHIWNSLSPGKKILQRFNFSITHQNVDSLSWILFTEGEKQEFKRMKRNWWMENYKNLNSKKKRTALFWSNKWKKNRKIYYNDGTLYTPYRDDLNKTDVSNCLRDTSTKLKSILKRMNKCFSEFSGKYKAEGERIEESLIEYVNEQKEEILDKLALVDEQQNCLLSWRDEVTEKFNAKVDYDDKIERNVKRELGKLWENSNMIEDIYLSRQEAMEEPRIMRGRYRGNKRGFMPKGLFRGGKKW